MTTLKDGAANPRPTGERVAAARPPGEGASAARHLTAETPYPLIQPLRGHLPPTGGKVSPAGHDESCPRKS